MQPAHFLLERMLACVADALGPHLLEEMAFVGGCTTALMVTDRVSLEAVRFTEDVDLILHVVGFADWARKQKALKAAGFYMSHDDEIICRMRLPGPTGQPLIVDFMPDDAKILGFSNRWYGDALHTAGRHTLTTGQEIRVVTPAYFVATKFEAYQGRGNNDPLASRDIEDILTVVDGRESLKQEIAMAAPRVRDYIAQQVAAMLDNPNFDYAVQAASRNNRGREQLLFRRLEAIATLVETP